MEPIPKHEKLDQNYFLEECHTPTGTMMFLFSLFFFLQI